MPTSAPPNVPLIARKDWSQGGRLHPAIRLQEVGSALHKLDPDAAHVSQAGLLPNGRSFLPENSSEGTKGDSFTSHFPPSATTPSLPGLENFWLPPVKSNARQTPGVRGDGTAARS